jgi:hypothetical protein
MNFISVEMDRETFFIANHLEGVFKPKLGDRGTHGIARVDILLNLQSQSLKDPRH